MKKYKGIWQRHKWLLLWLAVWLVAGLAFLTRWPVVHSDEPWLSGLTRNMLESGSLGVTESFFNLYPRYPHAIKTLFHLLQMPFLLLFGYNVFAFRLVSLLACAVCLLLFYLCALRFTQNRGFALAACVLLGCDAQFVYTAHMARSEAIILAALCACFLLLYSGKRHCAVWAGLITGLCIGIHPNSFALAGLCGGLLLWQCLAVKKLLWPRLLAYIGITGGFAAIFVGISFAFNPSFLQDYFAYGETLGVGDSLGTKLAETIPYFGRLFTQSSGTYNVPDIRVQLALFGLTLPIAALYGWRKRDISLAAPLLGLLGLWAALVVVGRLSQMYVVFIFPLCYLLLARLLAQLDPPRHGRYALYATAALLAVLTAAQAVPVATGEYSYSRYLAEIGSAVPANAKTLGNLNSEYHFENGALLDIRNLAYLEANGLTLREYIEDNGVEYLIISDELYWYYALRPQWNSLYGSLGYMPQLEALLKECELVHSFVDNQYAIRAIPYQNTGQDFTVYIYRYGGGG